nr:MAG TPA: ERCC4 domain protein [Caudoviricetes sp.]
MIKIENCKYKIVVDTREQKCNHILNKFDEGFENKPSHHDMYRGKKSTYTESIAYYKQEKGLKTGDFTICVQLPNNCQINFQDKIVIERKKDLNELCCNLFDKKDSEGLTRFERELKRAKEQGIKVILLVEIDNMHSKIMSSKHFRYDKASKVSPKSFNSILRSLQARYDISLEYCEKTQSARLIHDILYYHTREYLKNVSIINDSYVVEEK